MTMGVLRPGWAVKALLVLVIASLLFRCVSAAPTNHSVGGDSGWDLSSDLNQWASNTSFRVGDSLVFTYTPVHDLLEVNATDYSKCHTVNPKDTYQDGETVIPLREEGDRYFMCGRPGHCAMGLKLHVQVLPQLQTNVDTSPPPSSGPISTSTPPANRQRLLPSPPQKPAEQQPPPSPLPPHSSGSSRVEFTYSWVDVVVATMALILLRTLLASH